MGKMKKLPKFLEKYFWDVDFSKVNPATHRIYVIRRILEYGDEKSVGWMWEHFKRAEIKNTLVKFRGYSKKSANFWALILNIKKEDIKCLSESFLETRKKFWPH